MAVNFLVADDARVAVVFVHRNNPKCVGLWRWDLTDDRFYAGHWMLGKVHLRKTDLSPDGEYLLLLAANYSRKREIQSWTALTRAPFLTAIAFWRWIGTYGGGGLFGGKRLLINTLCERDTVPPDTASGRLPGTRGVNLGSGGGYHRRLSRASWSMTRGALSPQARRMPTTCGCSGYRAAGESTGIRQIFPVSSRLARDRR